MKISDHKIAKLGWVHSDDAFQKIHCEASSRAEIAILEIALYKLLSILVEIVDYVLRNPYVWKNESAHQIRDVLGVGSFVGAPRD